VGVHLFLEVHVDQFIPAVALVALVKKFIDFGAYLTNKRYRAAATQLVVWLAGIIAVCLYAQTDWADTFEFAGMILSKMNFATQIALGLGVGSTASFGTDLIKGIDNTDSARVPSLFPPSETKAA
jgi:hypothetical protein